MKITKVVPYIVHPGWRKNWLFVKVETDSGIVGWGECYTQYDRDQAIARHVEELGRYVLGRSPFNIKHFVQIAYDDYAQRRGSLELWSAVSGMEQAMWDVVGKAVDQPVYNLLGGACRPRIRVYANGWSFGAQQPEEYVRAAEAMLERGFTAMKFDPLPGPWRTYIPKEHEERATRVVAAVRDAVGPEVDLLIEVHRRLAPMHAVRLAERLAPFNPFWFEEPCPAENLSALAEIRSRVAIPVVTGEALYAKSGFAPVFETRAADIVNPDVCSVGGILELKEIAAMAEPHFVVVSPHNYNSTVLGLAATVQVSAVMPNFLITEYFVPFESVGHEVCREPLAPRNGYIELPERAGLGIEIEESAVASKGFQRYPARRIRDFTDEGP